MKNFFTSMLGALVALVVFFGGCFLLLVAIIAAIAAAGGGQQQVAEFERGSYLVLDLGAQITDAPEPVDLSFLGSQDSTLQLRTITRSIRAAAIDDRITGLYLSGDLSPVGYGAGYAALREVRNAIVDFKQSGKPVVAYLTFATTKGYYLASTATELTIDPYGVILMPGLASVPTFYAGAFEKYGINVQVTRVGKYKSAVEPFIRRDMSPENREELERLLTDIWGTLLADIAPAREITAEAIQTAVEQEGMIRGDRAKELRLVDRVAYRDEIYAELKEKTGRDRDSKRPFKQVALQDYAKAIGDKVDSLPAAEFTAAGNAKRIAVVYAEGDIVDGEGEVDQVGASRFSRELRRLRLDDSVKAVVLRVNSPGGSASASEVIQREVRLIKEVKPIVVSMGTYAASGGYWISTYADRIFAEDTTITGSIGVFGMQFDVQELANRFGITFDRVKTGRFADTLTITRPKSPEEMAMVQRMVDWIYEQFVSKVAESRNLPREKVEEIAQGRVWSGTEAVKLGLVDEIGGLHAAVAFAANKAGVGSDFRLVEYPRHMELLEVIQELLEQRRPSRAGAEGLAQKVLNQLEQDLKALRSFNDPRGVYARLPFDLSIN